MKIYDDYKKCELCMRRNKKYIASGKREYKCLADLQE